MLKRALISTVACPASHLCPTHLAHMAKAWTLESRILVKARALWLVCAKLRRRMVVTPSHAPVSKGFRRCGRTFHAVSTSFPHRGSARYRLGALFDSTSNVHDTDATELHRRSGKGCRAVTVAHPRIGTTDGKHVMLAASSRR